MSQSETGHASLLDVAGRIWEAAWALDELRGDRDASEWTARKVRDLWRQGRAHEESALTGLVRVLEAKLARERSARPATYQRSQVQTVPQG